MRENLYIQKLWNAFMRKKMEKEMRQSQTIDEAFKSIKTATGVTDVQEMVRKFLTREQTYSQLLMAVSESERKIDKLKKDNEELRARLHELQIDVASGAESGGSLMDEEIIEMNSSLNNLKKDFSGLQEKFKRINIVNDQISGWAKRVFGKFAALVDNSSLQPGQTDIVKIFEGMHLVVCDELKRLQDRQQEGEEDKAIEYGDVFTDFATEEFISKNIRVRPVSGVTHADETKDGR
jgi:predicted RNase H-like nuclease (RuvC/YqgF family)